ncbi:hypothetical protein [Paenarthrobacter sp. NPDC057981]|uniref:hypothetical protein n=1 Tax=Paenarthrobacter sp. NPDC057981 TaxID=3346297 RepID=UPI0036D9F69F
MALEWIGSVTTAVMGLAGIGATLWTQKRGRDNTLAVAAQNRTQDRKRAAYERLLTQAIHTTEFVGGADIIWQRNAQPPDVDFESFDAWLLLDLYASPTFLAGYQAWSGAVGRLRDILQELPEELPWYEAEVDIQESFRGEKDDMEDLLEALKDIARRELSQ